MELDYRICRATSQGAIIWYTYDTLLSNGAHACINHNTCKYMQMYIDIHIMQIHMYMNLKAFTFPFRYCYDDCFKSEIWNVYNIGDPGRLFSHTAPSHLNIHIYTILEFNLFDIIVMLIETSRAILISEIIKWIDEGRNSNRFLGAECRAAESATSVWVL